jgi:hypothetical protein
MSYALRVLLAVGVAGIVMTSLFVLGVRWRLRRRLRLGPGARSVAPIRWLVSPGWAARLHRRLRRAVSGAMAAGSKATTTAELARELQQHAIALEAHLVVAYQLGRPGAAQRATLTAQVVEAERLAVRLSHLAVESTQPAALASAGDSTIEPLAALGARLDALEAARAELGAVELRAGLASPSPPTGVAEPGIPA